jgi:hypothetical protein
VLPLGVGFNWSSQHLVTMEAFGGASSAGSRPGGQIEAEVVRSLEVGLLPMEEAAVVGSCVSRGVPADAGPRQRISMSWTSSKWKTQLSGDVRHFYNAPGRVSAAEGAAEGVMYQGRIQPVVATSWVNCSEGVIQPRVCRGRSLSSRATSSSSASVWVERSVPFGKY